MKEKNNKDYIYGLVSVITETYNSQLYISKLINSINSQTYNEIELIIVDDGSQDSTVNIVKENVENGHKIDICLIECEHRGQAAALKTGLIEAKGEFIFCIDSDDYINDEFIANMIEFARRSEAAYFFPSALDVDFESGEILGYRNPNALAFDGSYFLDILNSRNIVFAGHFFRTEKLRIATNNFDIFTGPGGQNVQLLLPMSWYFRNPVFVESSLYYISRRMGSHSRKIENPYDYLSKLNDYRNIYINTINNITDMESSVKKEYIRSVEADFSRKIYQNSFPTKDKALIKRCFAYYRKYGNINLKDILLYIKYTININI